MTSDDVVQTDTTVEPEVSFAEVAAEGPDESIRKEREATAHLSDQDDRLDASVEASDVDGEQNATPHQPAISSMTAFGPDSSSDVSTI